MISFLISEKGFKVGWLSSNTFRSVTSIYFHLFIGRQSPLSKSESIKVTKNFSKRILILRFRSFKIIKFHQK